MKLTFSIYSKYRLLASVRNCNSSRGPEWNEGQGLRKKCRGGDLFNDQTEPSTCYMFGSLFIYSPGILDHLEVRSLVVKLLEPFISPNPGDDISQMHGNVLCRIDEMGHVLFGIELQELLLELKEQFLLSDLESPLLFAFSIYPLSSWVKMGTPLIVLQQTE